jgi:hypothetical protein
MRDFDAHKLEANAARSANLLGIDDHLFNRKVRELEGAS